MVLSIVFSLAIGASGVGAGPCDNYSNTASDGSQCGLRSEDSRKKPSASLGLGTNEDSHTPGWFLRVYDVDGYTIIGLTGYGQDGGKVRIDCSTNKQPTISYIAPKLPDELYPNYPAEMHFSVDDRVEILTSTGVYDYLNGMYNAVTIDDSAFVASFIHGLAEAESGISLLITVSGRELVFDHTFPAPSATDTAKTMQNICFSG